MTELEYFEELYRTDEDPWRLASSPYERRKRGITVASLPREHYRVGFEPACATGQLTTMLSFRCDRLIASDPVATAVERTRDVVPAHVDVVQAAIPDSWPDEELDLVVLSEVLYFLDPQARATTARLTREHLAADGHVVAVHWRHGFEESATPPNQAHEDLHTCGLRLLVAHVEEDFRLEVFGRG